MRLSTKVNLESDQNPILKAINELLSHVEVGIKSPYIIISNDEVRDKALRNIFLSKETIVENEYVAQFHDSNKKFRDITEYQRIVEMTSIYRWDIDNSPDDNLIIMRDMLPIEYYQYSLNKEFKRLSRLSNEFSESINNLREILKEAYIKL